MDDVLIMGSKIGTPSKDKGTPELVRLGYPWVYHQSKGINVINVCVM